MTSSSIPQKRCTKCGAEHPATTEYFHKRTSKRDGLDTQCKVCVGIREKKRYERNPEQKRKYQRDIRAKYIDRYRERERNHTETHREEARERTRQWVKENPERKRENDRQYYQNVLRYDRDKRRDELRAWRQANPDKAHAQLARRRARKRGLPATFTPDDWQRALDYFNGCCAICGRAPSFWHILAQEHWIPITDKRPDNPGTVATNMIPMCHSMKDGEGGCNNSKSNKDPIEWLIEKFGKRKAKQIQERVEAYFEWLMSVS